MTEVKVIGASWCCQCKAFTPKVKEFCEQHSIPFTYLDAEENDDLVQSLGIRNIPVVLVYEDDRLKEKVFMSAWEDLKQTLVR